MSQCVLLSDLDQSRFHEDKGIGGPDICVKLFENREAAEQFAAAMIRNYDDGTNYHLAASDADVVEEFQDSLGALEYFHVRDVVE